MGAPRLAHRGRVRTRRGSVQSGHGYAEALAARELPGRRCPRHAPRRRSRTGRGPRRVAVRRRTAGRGAAVPALGSRTRAGRRRRAVGASARGPRPARTVPGPLGWRCAVRLTADRFAGGPVREARPRRDAPQRRAGLPRRTRLACGAPVERGIRGRPACRRVGRRRARPLARRGQLARDRRGHTSVASCARRATGLPLTRRARAQRPGAGTRGVGRTRMGSAPRDGVRCAVGVASGSGRGAFRA